MKEFTFDYTDIRFMFRLLGLCFLAFVLLLLAMPVTSGKITIVGSLLSAVALPFGAFFLFRNKLTKQGTAYVYDHSTELRLIDSSESIVYSEIKSYKLERYNGTQLIVKFRNGRRLRMQANSNFCNPAQFEEFCVGFEEAVQRAK